MDPEMRLTGETVEETAHAPSWLWVIAGLIGAGFTALGVLLLVSPILLPAALASVAAVLVGDGLIALSLGLGLMIAGHRGWRRRPSPRFYGTRSWWIALVISLVVGGIGLLLPGEVHQRPFFGLLHFVLIAAPALFLFSLTSLAAGRQVAAKFRHLMLTVSGGVSAILLAAPVEIVGLVVSGAVSAMVILFLPGGEGEIDRLLGLMQRWTEQPSTQSEDVLALLASPVVLMTLVLTLSLITPLVEELSKTLIVGVLGHWMRPGLLTSYLWGAAGGLGFALFEGISNGALALGETAGWLGGVGTRFFTTAMHAFTSGLVGLGWGFFWQRRRPRRWWLLLLGYVLAILFHGAWNFNVILTLGSLGVAVSSPLLGGGGLVIGVVVQIALIVVALVGLVGIPLFLRRRSIA